MTRIGDGVLDRRGSLGLVLVFGGQTLPTGGEVGLRAGRPWSVACEILRPGDASAVPRCPDQWGPGDWSVVAIEKACAIPNLPVCASVSFQLECS